jgi:hypothetical protein
MQQPHVGKMVNPATEIARGVSSVQGIAVVTTRQQAWIWALRAEQPSVWQFNPRQQQGRRQGAPGLQQHSALMQQTPAYRWNGYKAWS